MDDPWNCSPIQPAPPDLCPFGQAPQTLFFDNFEAGLAYWTTPIAQGSFPWTLGSFLGPYATSGANMLWGYDAYNVTDSRAEMIYPVAIPSGDIRVQFNHSYGFDNGSYTLWDGGVIEYTLDGVSWGDAGGWITQGASYRGTIAGGYQNPLAGRAGFGFDSFGYTASQLNISGLAGQNVRFRFRIGADNSYDDYGWFVDDVRIYKCVAAQVQVASPNGGEALPGGSTQLVTWTGATTPDGTLEVYYNDGVTRTLLAKLAGTARSYLWTVPTATTTTGKIEIESKVKAGTEATDQSDATFSITAPAPLPPKIDFNGDGESDILWHHQGDGEPLHLVAPGDGHDGRLVPHAAGVLGHEVADPRGRRLQQGRPAGHPVAPPDHGRPLRLVPERHDGHRRQLPDAAVVLGHAVADPWRRRLRPGRQPGHPVAPPGHGRPLRLAHGRPEGRGRAGRLLPQPQPLRRHPLADPGRHRLHEGREAGPPLAPPGQRATSTCGRWTGTR